MSTFIEWIQMLQKEKVFTINAKNIIKLVDVKKGEYIIKLVEQILRFNKIKLISKKLPIFKTFVKKRLEPNFITTRYTIPILIDNKVHAVIVNRTTFFVKNIIISFINNNTYFAPLCRFNEPNQSCNYYGYAEIVRNIFDNTFKDLSKVYMYILTNQSLFNTCIYHVTTNKEKYKKRIYCLPRDIRKYIVE